MSMRRSLSQLHNDVKENIDSKLKEIKNSNEASEDIETIAYGTSIKIQNLRPPVIWYMRDSYQPEQTGAQTERHDIPYSFVATVRDNDPSKGEQRADNLVNDVYDFFMQDRQLGGEIHNIEPGSVDPEFVGTASKKLFWSSNQLIFVVKRTIV